LVEVLGLDHVISAQLFLRLGERAVRGDGLPVLTPHRGRRAGRLEWIDREEGAAPADAFGELAVLLENRGLFRLGPLIPQLLVVVDQEHITHGRTSFHPLVERGRSNRHRPWQSTRMNYDLEDGGLPTVVAEASLIAEETKRVFGGLSGEQVNWKPGVGEWSIGQCFDHLVLSNHPYVRVFEEILAGQRRSRVWERVPLLPHLFGRLL